MSGAVAAFFAQVLALCARLGMGKPGVVALDGMKIAASAPEPANRTGESLRKLAAETVARHGETDAAEDGLFGAGARGDEVPQDAWSPRRRAERIAAALARLAAERAAAEAQRAAKEAQYLADAAAGTPRAGNPPAGAAAGLAAMAVAQQAKAGAWQARAAAGRPPAGPARPARTAISGSARPPPGWRRPGPGPPRPGARPRDKTTTAPRRRAISPAPTPG